MLNDSSLSVATSTYFWKPMAAFFRSVEMGIYRDQNVTFEGPVLDLGCGDGGILSMLGKMGVVKGDCYGMDIDYVELEKASKRHLHVEIYQGDANRLPFASECFTSIICNGVLSSIPQGIDNALNEIHRVLKKNGTIVITVPTKNFIDVLVIPKILGLISTSLRERYVKKLNLRLTHFTTLTSEEWTEQFNTHGLSVETVKTFLSPKAGGIWNILSMQVFRIFALLNKIDRLRMGSFFSRLEKTLFKLIYTEEPVNPPLAGYAFFICRKKNG